MSRHWGDQASKKQPNLNQMNSTLTSISSPRKGTIGTGMHWMPTMPEQATWPAVAVAVAVAAVAV